MSGAEETTRRFPHLSVALPYAFGSLSIPVPADREPLGSIAVVWAAPPGGRALSPARRARGERIDGDAWPEALEAPAPAARMAPLDGDLDTGGLTGDDRLCALFGVDPRHFDGTFGSLLAGVGPGELAALPSAVRDTAAHGRTVVQPLRVPVPKGAGRTLELWGRVPHATGGPGPPHLVGARGAAVGAGGAGRPGQDVPRAATGQRPDRGGHRPAGLRGGPAHQLRPAFGDQDDALVAGFRALVEGRGPRAAEQPSDAIAGQVSEVQRPPQGAGELDVRLRHDHLAGQQVDRVAAGAATARGPTGLEGVAGATPRPVARQAVAQRRLLRGGTVNRPFRNAAPESTDLQGPVPRRQG